MTILDTLRESELGQYILTLLVSMLPVVELRGAIPVGVSMGINPWVAMGVSIIGNMIPVPFIILFIRRIFEWMKVRIPKLGNAINRLETKAEGKWEKVGKYELLGLAILVAIPLPGTGAWTGALIAAIMNIRIKYAIPTILLGVIVAGFLVTGVTYGFTLAIS